MGKTNFYNKNVKREPYSDVHAVAQLRATKALLKFCNEHGRSEDDYIGSIKSCSEALEEKDIKTAIKHYLDVPLGGNGCFNDWWPPVVYDHETDEYVWAVFEALTSTWSRVMRLSVEK
jgi:hypothetical protein